MTDKDNSKDHKCALEEKMSLWHTILFQVIVGIWVKDLHADYTLFHNYFAFYNQLKSSVVRIIIKAF